MIQNLLNFGNTGMSFAFHEFQFSMAENLTLMEISSAHNFEVSLEVSFLSIL